MRDYPTLHLNKNQSKDTAALLVLNRGRDRMVVGFATTYAISGYHH
jgi:hypothetical protein